MFFYNLNLDLTRIGLPYNYPIHTFFLAYFLMFAFQDFESNVFIYHELKETTFGV